VNLLKLSAENPDELLNASSFGAGALIRVESSTTGGGAGFSEVGTVAIVAGTTLYTYYDQVAASGLYYRSRYSNSGNTNRSDYSAEFQANDTYPTYCSLYDAKQRLTIAATDTTDDENLLQFVGQASSWIESRTGRTFLPDPPSGTKTYTFDGTGAIENGRCLLIPRGIRSITLLQNGLYTGATLQTIPATDYFLQPSPQNRDPGWPATELWLTDIPSSGNPVPYFAYGFQNIAITGAFGWASTPSEIEDIALTAVVSMWRSRGSAGGETITIGTTGERTIERSLSYEQRATLSRYTLKTVVIV